MQYGKVATELLRELQRDKKQIPPYNVSISSTPAHIPHVSHRSSLVLFSLPPFHSSLCVDAVVLRCV